MKKCQQSRAISVVYLFDMSLRNEKSLMAVKDRKDMFWRLVLFCVVLILAECVKRPQGDKQLFEASINPYRTEGYKKVFIVNSCHPEHIWVQSALRGIRMLPGVRSVGFQSLLSWIR